VISGDAFLEKYGDHNDTVTVIDPKRFYSVKAPTRHPIYENFRVEVKSPHHIIYFYTAKSIFQIRKAFYEWYLFKVCVLFLKNML